MPKFKLRSTGSLYYEDEVTKLIKLGFKFKPYTGKYGDYDYFKVDECVLEIEINTFEEFLELIGEHDIIVMGANEIEIYDDNRE